LAWPLRRATPQTACMLALRKSTCTARVADAAAHAFCWVRRCHLPPGAAANYRRCGRAVKYDALVGCGTLWFHHTCRANDNADRTAVGGLYACCGVCCRVCDMRCILLYNAWCVAAVCRTLYVPGVISHQAASPPRSTRAVRCCRAELTCVPGARARRRRSCRTVADAKRRLPRATRCDALRGTPGGKAFSRDHAPAGRPSAGYPLYHAGCKGTAACAPPSTDDCGRRTCGTVFLIACMV